MVENISEINYDYINQKLLYLLLIKGCSVVIRPFEYEQKLDGLFELLRSFYIIEQIDMNQITNPAHLDGFFSSYDDNEKKSLLLLKNITQDTMNEVIKYPEILFIALEKDLSIDYSNFQKIALFNKKTKKISKLIPNSLISVNSLAYKWVNEKIITDLKSLGIVEIRNNLSRIYEKMCSLFDLLPAINKSLYEYFCSDLTPNEQKVVNAICGHYYNIKLPEFTKKTIIPKNIEEKKLDVIENEEKIEHESRDEMQYIDENQINQEIWELINTDRDSSGYNAFSLALNEIKIQSEKTLSTPEKKYFYLRSTLWKTQIPFTFFKNLFLYYVREEIKNDSVSKSNINMYLRDKHDQLIGNCSMIASPEFKQLDPTIFAVDEILKSYLKKEPIISHILPVQNHTNKSVSPKEIEKMFAQRFDSNEKSDFDTQYQKNLEKLKDEFGEKEINSQLIDKLRNRTKDLQNRITTLFQD